MKMKPTNQIKTCTPKYLTVVIDSTDVPNFLSSPPVITEKAQETFHSFLDYSHSGTESNKLYLTATQ